MPLTKTEQEYYSRSVKKKVVALANAELHGHRLNHILTVAEDRQPEEPFSARAETETLRPDFVAMMDMSKKEKITSEPAATALTNTQKVNQPFLSRRLMSAQGNKNGTVPRKSSVSWWNFKVVPNFLSSRYPPWGRMPPRYRGLLYAKSGRDVTISSQAFSASLPDHYPHRQQSHLLLLIRIKPLQSDKVF